MHLQKCQLRILQIEGPILHFFCNYLNVLFILTNHTKCLILNTFLLTFE